MTVDQHNGLLVLGICALILLWAIALWPGCEECRKRHEADKHR